jgi:hypothetical protein
MENKSKQRGQKKHHEPNTCLKVTFPNKKIYEKTMLEHLDKNTVNQRKEEQNLHCVSGKRNA